MGGANRHIDLDPNVAKSYYTDTNLYGIDTMSDKSKLLTVPFSQRTGATSEGVSDYQYWTMGSFSTAVPYFSGLYALGCQAYPELTSELFWSTLSDTAKPLDDKVYLVNPPEYITTLKGL